MNKVSIVIPVYNVEKYIEDCLMSVAEQSYPLIEIVLIDDCGTDNSMKIVENTLKKIIGELSEITGREVSEEKERKIIDMIVNDKVPKDIDKYV